MDICIVTIQYYIKKGLKVSNPRILEKKDVSHMYQNIQITKKKNSASTSSTSASTNYL